MGKLVNVPPWFQYPVTGAHEVDVKPVEALPDMHSCWLQPYEVAISLKGWKTNPVGFA